jgi:opacity protein-like surface antigen
MMRRFLVFGFLVLCLAAPAAAQYHVEASGFVGWTVSDGVSFNGLPINGAVYTRADPKDSADFGFTFGGYLTPQVEIEFLWSRQMSAMEVRGTGPTLSGDMNVDNYHGNFVYNFGDEDLTVRPYLLMGLGATSFGESTFPSRTVPGDSQFSWALGAGVKAFPSPHVGLKAGMRWTPTYIKSDPGGTWCDPFWGCYTYANPYYANQFEFSGGIVARF